MYIPGKEPFAAKLGRFIGNLCASLVAVFIVILLFVLMCKILQFIV